MRIPRVLSGRFASGWCHPKYLRSSSESRMWGRPISKWPIHHVLSDYVVSHHHDIGAERRFPTHRSLWMHETYNSQPICVLKIMYFKIADCPLRSVYYTKTMQTHTERFVLNVSWMGSQSRQHYRLRALAFVVVSECSSSIHQVSTRLVVH